jgi:hypothetical protein
MREIRTSGSEGGGIEANRCFLPLYLLHRFRGIDRVELPVISYESCLSCVEHSGLSGPSI